MGHWWVRLGRANHYELLAIRMHVIVDCRCAENVIAGDIERPRWGGSARASIDAHRHQLASESIKELTARSCPPGLVSAVRRNLRSPFQFGIRRHVDLKGTWAVGYERKAAATGRNLSPELVLFLANEGARSSVARERKKPHVAAGFSARLVKGQHSAIGRSRPRRLSPSTFGQAFLPGRPVRGAPPDISSSRPPRRTIRDSTAVGRPDRILTAPFRGQPGSTLPLEVVDKNVNQGVRRRQRQ